MAGMLALYPIGWRVSVVIGTLFSFAEERYICILQSGASTSAGSMLVSGPLLQCVTTNRGGAVSHNFSPPFQLQPRRPSVVEEGDRHRVLAARQTRRYALLLQPANLIVVDQDTLVQEKPRAVIRLQAELVRPACCHLNVAIDECCDVGVVELGHELQSKRSATDLSTSLLTVRNSVMSSKSM
eukprot:765213-Hanusia_phi.AAC.4